MLLSQQCRAIDPIHAVKRTIVVNKVGKDDPLFSYLDAKGRRYALTVNKLLEVCNRVWSKYGIPRMTGHWWNNTLSDLWSRSAGGESNGLLVFRCIHGLLEGAGCLVGQTH